MVDFDFRNLANGNAHRYFYHHHPTPFIESDYEEQSLDFITSGSDNRVYDVQQTHILALIFAFL